MTACGGLAAAFARKALELARSKPESALDASTDRRSGSSGEVNVRIHSQLITLHGQSEVSVDLASECPATSLTRPVLGGMIALDDPGEHRVTVLSAALLQAVMTTFGDDHAGLAVRAGVAAAVVAEVASGTWPAWALPYDEFTALADAVAALWPCAALETAAACDLLLSCVLNGDQCMATDVLTEPCSHDLARALLRLVITSERGRGICKAEPCLLPEDLLALLSERAAALAGTESPDAWVGLEILIACTGRQS